MHFFSLVLCGKKDIELLHRDKQTNLQYKIQHIYSKYI